MQDQNKRAIDVILNVLPPGLAKQVQRREHDSGTTLEIPVGTTVAKILPRWAGQGFPRDLDLAMANLPSRPDGQIVLTAVAFSAGSRTKLRELGFSWADETGRAQLEVDPGLYVTRDTQAIKIRQRGLPDDKWNLSIGAVAETILASAIDAGWSPANSDEHVLHRIDPLSAMASVSPSQTVAALQMFDRAGYTIKSGAERGPSARRILADPGGLLSAWGGWRQTQHSRAQGMHVLWDDIREFINGPLAHALGDQHWAITGWLAADVIAPYAARVSSFSVYIDPMTFDRGLSDLVEQIGLRPVETGARITFLRAEPHVLNQSRTVEGMPCVSVIRLYGDLIRLGARGDDAASHLREIRIGW